MKKNVLHNSLLLVIVLGVMYVASKVSVNFIFGANSFGLTGMGFIFPILGSVFALPQALMAIGLFCFIRMLFGGALMFGIPTFLATANWTVHFPSEKSKRTSALTVAKFFLQIIIPLSCMILFIAHPQGRGAALYSFYWLIPGCCFMVQTIFKKSWAFSIALSSTFIAHAVGSIIALYTLAIPTQSWLTLIPLVAVERMIFASGATLLFYAMKTTFVAATNVKHLVTNENARTDLN